MALDSKRFIRFVWKLERRPHSVDVSVALRNNRWRALQDKVQRRNDEIERGAKYHVGRTERYG